MTASEASFALTVFCALGSGVVGGVFYAFSTFVMAALARLPAAQGIAAMQAINITVINPVFFAAFLGTAAACLVLAGFSLRGWARPGAGWQLAGCGIYMAGCILVTMVCNVPRNDALAKLDPAAAASAAPWASYVAEWTAWNHVRTVAGIAAMATFLAGLCRQAAAR